MVKDRFLSERYEKIELFISNDEKAVYFGLPLKIIAVDRKEQVRKRVQFDRIKKNKGLKAADIKLPRKTKHWEILE